MKNTTIIILAALALPALLSSCVGEKNPDKTADGCMSIDASGKGEKIKLSDIIDTIEYIPLETNENCLIGRIDKVIGMGDTVAVLDDRIGRALYLFGRDGRFIRKIGQQGEGPQEYIHLFDMTYDRATDRIFLLDLGGNKILVFNSDNGFIKSIDIEDTYANGIEYLGEEKMALYLNYGRKNFEKDGRTPLLMIYDMENNRRDGLYVWHDSYIDPTMIINTRIVFDKQADGSVLFATSHIDTVYRITRDEVSPIYAIRFDKEHDKNKADYNSFVKSKRPDTVTGLERRKKNPFYYTTMCGTDDFVLLSATVVDKNSRYIAIDKNTGHVKLSTKAGKGRRIIENDMDIFANFGRVGADSRYIYSDTDPAIFKFLTEKYINKYNKPMVEHYKDRKSEDSNPVIVAFRTKGF